MSAATLRNANTDLEVIASQLKELNDALLPHMPVDSRARVSRARNELLCLQREVRERIGADAPVVYPPAP